MKSVMTTSHNFASVPRANIDRSTFDRSSGLKTTIDFDYLYPCFIDEVLPGDTFKLKANLFGRLATPINPIMDNARISTFFFFVPNRLVWDNFKKFMGEQENPGDSTDYTIPQVGTGSWSELSIGDYFGLPTKVNITHSVLPLRAYNLIWNEWFRDQNLQNSVTVNKTDGPESKANFTLLKRGKRHDYFTSALPWTQKGDPVSVPLGDKAPVAGLGIPTVNNTPADGSTYRTSTGTETFAFSNSTGTIDLRYQGTGSSVGDNLDIYADLSSATGSTINAWRQAFQIQKFLEKQARGGTRMVEVINSHFGVSNAGGDARLQRPEYLGGGTSNINIHPVAQQSSTDATTPQGNLSAFGTFAEGNSGFTKSFTEPGHVIGLMCATADLTYSQGMDRMWSRSTLFDHYFPSFAFLGEQAILSKEIYADGTASDEDVFGYQERFSEYRYKPSKITGLFRPNATASLDAWHLSQEFSSRPLLNDTFIESDTPVDRVIAVPAEPHLIIDGYFQLQCTRPMPTYAPPGLIDHF